MTPFLPARKSYDWGLPAIYPVSSVAETLKFFPTENNLKNSSIQSKNSRWNTFVSFAKMHNLQKSSFLPEDLLNFQTYLLDHQNNVKKPDDYIVTARQRLLILRRLDVSPSSQQLYEEVIRSRIALGNKSYSPHQALPITSAQLKIFKHKYPAYASLADFWLFTGFRMSSISSESLTISAHPNAPGIMIVSTNSKSAFNPETSDWRYVPQSIASPIKPLIPIPRWKLDLNIVKHLTGKSHSFRRTTALALRIRAERLQIPLQQIQSRINRCLGWKTDADSSFKHYTRDYINFLGVNLPASEELLDYVFRKPKISKGKTSRGRATKKKPSVTEATRYNKSEA